MIYLLMVLTPMLKNNPMKIAMTANDIKPPVNVVYYASPLYLRRLLVGKRSIFLKNLCMYEQQAGI